MWSYLLPAFPVSASTFDGALGNASSLSLFLGLFAYTVNPPILDWTGFDVCIAGLILFLIVFGRYPVGQQRTGSGKPQSYKVGPFFRNRPVKVFEAAICIVVLSHLGRAEARGWESSDWLFLFSYLLILAIFKWLMTFATDAQPDRTANESRQPLSLALQVAGIPMLGSSIVYASARPLNPGFLGTATLIGIHIALSIPFLLKGVLNTRKSRAASASSPKGIGRWTVNSISSTTGVILLILSEVVEQLMGVGGDQKQVPRGLTWVDVVELVINISVVLATFYIYPYEYKVEPENSE